MKMMMDGEKGDGDEDDDDDDEDEDEDEDDDDGHYDGYQNDEKNRKIMMMIILKMMTLEIKKKTVGSMTDCVEKP